MLAFLNIAGKNVPTYGVLAVIGILAAYLYIATTNSSGKAGQIPTVDVLHILVIAIIGAVFGAKLFYLIGQIPAIVQNWQLIAQNLSVLLAFLSHGLVFYGGLFGGITAVYLYCKSFALSFNKVMGLCTPAIPLFHFFGRIGCFLVGCCWGVPVLWGFKYTSSPVAPNLVPLLPVQLIEAALNAALFIILAVISRKISNKSLIFLIYLINYSVIRFFLEFLRADAQRGVVLLSTSQWLSIVVLATSLYFIKINKKQI